MQWLTTSTMMVVSSIMRAPSIVFLFFLICNENPSGQGSSLQVGLLFGLGFFSKIKGFFKHEPWLLKQINRAQYAYFMSNHEIPLRSVHLLIHCARSLAVSPYHRIIRVHKLYSQFSQHCFEAPYVGSMAGVLKKNC